MPEARIIATMDRLSPTAPALTSATNRLLRSNYEQRPQQQQKRQNRRRRRRLHLIKINHIRCDVAPSAPRSACIACRAHRHNGWQHRAVAVDNGRERTQRQVPEEDRTPSVRSYAHPPDRPTPNPTQTEPSAPGGECNTLTNVGATARMDACRAHVRTGTHNLCVHVN